MDLDNLSSAWGCVVTLNHDGYDDPKKEIKINEKKEMESPS